MGNNIKYTINSSLFKPVDFGQVRWLLADDFHYMHEFWNMSLQDWNEAKEEGYTYCAFIEDEKIVSLAAVWKYSKEKWEVAAVNTRKNYENLGLAKKVVSFVTNYILSNNKIPTLTTDKDNIAMQKVAEKVGFKEQKE